MVPLVGVTQRVEGVGERDAVPARDVILRDWIGDADAVTQDSLPRGHGPATQETDLPRGHGPATQPTDLPRGLAGVTTASHVLLTIQQNRAGLYVQSAVPAAGSFTIYLNNAVTADTQVAYFVLN